MSIIFKIESLFFQNPLKFLSLVTMEIDTKNKISKEILLKAFNHMMVAKATADVYEENRNICKYVHSTSRGHEAIQLATAEFAVHTRQNVVLMCLKSPNQDQVNTLNHVLWSADAF